jgi:hypothetical protein
MSPSSISVQLQVKLHHYPGGRLRPTDPEGSSRKDAGKSSYPAGKHRISLEGGSSIPT